MVYLICNTIFMAIYENRPTINDDTSVSLSIVLFIVFSSIAATYSITKLIIKRGSIKADERNEVINQNNQPSNEVTTVKMPFELYDKMMYRICEYLNTKINKNERFKMLRIFYALSLFNPIYEERASAVYWFYANVLFHERVIINFAYEQEKDEALKRILKDTILKIQL